MGLVLGRRLCGRFRSLCRLVPTSPCARRRDYDADGPCHAGGIYPGRLLSSGESRLERLDKLSTMKGFNFQDFKGQASIHERVFLPSIGIG